MLEGDTCPWKWLIGSAVTPDPRQPNQISSSGNVELAARQSFDMARSIRYSQELKFSTWTEESRKLVYRERKSKTEGMKKEIKMRLRGRALSMCLKSQGPVRVLPEGSLSLGSLSGPCIFKLRLLNVIYMY